jgi:protein tyrosine phosphatase (PTP) superfamily phosphohydrolase (DUF442 family)
MEEILNYIQINDTLSTAGQPTKKQFKQIAQAGFEVVVNLAMHNKGALPEEDKIVTKNRMLYIHIPITWKKPELDRLKFFLSTMEMLHKQNKKVFVHCIMNYRASVFVYKYRKHVLKEKRVTLVAPKAFKPNGVWKRVIKAKVD